ncbi:MAG: hypothetical protein IJ962_05380 [Clostridia bacterium]|nr:hypothetical protein [Clostridia bacterium]
MKKTIALLLSVIMILSIFTVSVAAEKEAEEWKKYPLILVPGYTSTSLYKLDENGNKVEVWGDVLGIIGSGMDTVGVVEQLVKSIKEDDSSYFSKKIGEGFNRLFADLACNNDGTSKTPLYPYVNTAEENNYANLRATYPDGKYQPEPVFAELFAEKIGYENIYAFSSDFRMGAIELSDKLRGYIDEVLEHTNKNRAEKDKVDKVNIYAISHGGQISGTYLTRYGHEGKVNKAVLTIPALGGAQVACDMFNADTKFNLAELITFLEHGMMFEEDYHQIVDIIDLSIGDSLIDGFFPVAIDTLLYWGSLWDFMPLKHYDEMKEKFLDPVRDAEFIAKSDKMHYEVMSPDGKDYFGKGFKRAQDVGTDIYILAGYDCNVFTGTGESADMLITTESSTGATVSPYGKRFNDGYIQKVDTGLYQVSPSFTVDASTSYMPYHTWFIEHYYHGMTLNDDYTRSLAMNLLFTDNSYDVTTMKGYSQFHATSNVAHGVHAQFNNCTEGHLTKDSNALIVKNLSAEKDILLMKVNVDGLEISFPSKPVVIKAGESAEIPFTGEIPDIRGKNFEVTVSYFAPTLTVLGERKFEFTLMGKEQIVYDTANPFVDANFVSRIDTHIDENTNTFLVNTGLKDTASIIFNMFYDLVVIIDKLFDFLKIG